MIESMFSIIFNTMIYGGFIFILLSPIISFLSLYIQLGAKGYNKYIEEKVKEREEKIATFWGMSLQSNPHNNQSNITDDAFLLFVGEQKLAFGHPEATKHITEEW